MSNPLTASCNRGDQITSSQTVSLEFPPPGILDGSSLFLDFDGTVVELAERPDGVVVNSSLTSLLERLNDRLEGRMAIVSGRSLDQLDQLLGPIAQSIACTGSHGCEHRWPGLDSRPVRPASLDLAASNLHRFAKANPGSVVEEKSFGVALHYRGRPDVERDALELASKVANDLGLYLQLGKMMAELRLPGGGKGSAIRQMMTRQPMLGTHPLFFGDDQTDEPGFVVAAELGGAGILVGEPRQTAARFGLRDPSAVRGWLAGALT